MPVIGRRQGTGVLGVKNQRFSNISYTLAVLRTGLGTNSAGGRLAGSHAALLAAFHAILGEVRFTLEDGSDFQITLSEYDLAGNAEFVSAGPIPSILIAS